MNYIAKLADNLVDALEKAHKEANEAKAKYEAVRDFLGERGLLDEFNAWLAAQKEGCDDQN